jgi:hypothetical protein
LLFSFGLGLLLTAGPALAQTTSSGFSSAMGGGLGSGLDLQKAQSAARNGLSDQEMDSACEAAVAKHMTSADVDALSRTLGMSPAQTAQLSDCISRGGPTPNAAQNGNPALSYPMQAPARPLESSRLESRFHELDNPYKMLAAPKAATLEQFGYDLFATRVSSFAPTGNVPVGDDYIMGPDDELNIYNWGRVNQTVKLKVDRDGAVMVPEIGPIQIGGLTFGQAKKTHRRPHESNHRGRSRGYHGPGADHPGLCYRKCHPARTLHGERAFACLQCAGRRRRHQQDGFPAQDRAAPR